jgi:hypothetical protein
VSTGASLGTPVRLVEQSSHNSLFTFRVTDPAVPDDIVLNPDLLNGASSIEVSLKVGQYVELLHKMKSDYRCGGIKGAVPDSHTNSGLRTVNFFGCGSDDLAFSAIAKTPGTETITITLKPKDAASGSPVVTKTVIFHVTGEALPPTPNPDNPTPNPDNPTPNPTPNPDNPTPTPTPDVSNPVNDGPQDVQFKEEIKALLAAGISTGVVDSEGKVHFYADHQLTRGQLAAFLYRIAGEPTVGPTDISSSFPDAKTHQFKNAIAWLRAKGYAIGDANGNFQPDTNIKRQEIAKLVVNVFKLKAKDSTGGTQNFSDVDANDQFAPYILVLKNLNISTGVNNFFYPLDEISRGQMSKFLMLSLAVVEG